MGRRKWDGGLRPTQFFRVGRGVSLAPQHRLTTTTDTTTDIHYTHYTIHYTHYTSNYARLCSITLAIHTHIQHFQKRVQHIQERVNVYARPQARPLTPHTTFLMRRDFSPPADHLQHCFFSFPFIMFH